MKVTLLVIGKTDAPFLKEGMGEYIKRLNHYINFEIVVIPDIKKTKNVSTELQKAREGELIISKDSPGKEFHLFDEKGKMYSSREFAGFLEKKMASGLKELVFVIGGPYGFSPKVYEMASSKISLSRFTFSHQMARLLCTEQIYRAFTILKNEPYHHD
ncbi:MAG: 23S rRNA (pseudouridine(1915)-N(3))-methyltransferase RlmH [Prolixibacteraceae bacterium]|jgi:23S rRNA (pseudouridine1915-N3)-methyltransferase|nr:23S rRNA (pseudouridine(1915)-N(3))-methyltransferase RlmH [Prolixibacteraceae bacterium]MBT6004853.1 23S rRNA (pseudouridine(1915)-N(3))-methyltransferase RlmH [Prolixibacteraceae bacterium]MBT6766330.1 23S rRNA (pseudouridine(1915)-N(3))-methyltransferase RlmH [Prolixibacteraceae bacterium]MBT6998812.1 23S rRNA (pseudouridine(1915)-N(3))-methyltransferase RlmH [Prolixibacteraceae bacterium]MBT7396690.1 23S rRNA (pseudouridine(1915)-N(3))-methyltransferase RlmH [Prolixibacteraceae bacterium